MLDGRLDDVERSAEQALRFGQALGNPDCLGVYHAHIGLIRMQQGRIAEATELFEAAAERVPLVAVKAGLAWAHAEGGRLAEARALVDRIGGSSLQTLPHDYLRAGSLGFLARACVALGDHELALRLHDELVPYRDQMVVGHGSAYGAVAHSLGLLAALLQRPHEADAHFAFAEAFQERTGARGFLVHTRLDWAHFLLRRGEPGDHERAGALAAAAAQLAQELDRPVLAERAMELLATSRTAG